MKIFRSRTFKIMAVILAGYFLLWAPALIWPSLLDSPLGITIVMPYLSVYLFHQMGIPGLLQNNGACGWGWCAPTLFGWFFIVAFWLLVVWLVAKIINTVIEHP